MLGHGVTDDLAGYHTSSVIHTSNTLSCQSGQTSLSIRENEVSNR
jgi:hypothetical protein